MNSRVLGTLCIVGSLVGMSDGARALMVGERMVEGLRLWDSFTAFAVLVGAVGGLCGLLGFIALRGTGNNPIFRALAILPGISYVAAMLAGLGSLTGVLTADANNPAALMLAVLMDVLHPAAWLVVAILTFAAGSWRGWRRWAPLAIVLAFPLGILAAEITQLRGAFIVINSAALVLLGYAVQSSAPVERLREATA